MDSFEPRPDAEGGRPDPYGEGQTAYGTDTAAEPAAPAGQSGAATPGGGGQPDTAAPDPKKPLPGETYADYWRRLEREKNAEREETDYARQEYWNGFQDHGHGVSGDPNYGPIPEEYASNGMSKIAFLCGIASLFSILFGGSLFFGAFGVLFAFLSRKNRFGRQARIALWMSCAGIIAFIVAMAVSLSMLISSGLMDKLIDRVKNADPNDPTAITEIQQELMEDLLKRYGARY